MGETDTSGEFDGSIGPPNRLKRRSVLGGIAGIAGLAGLARQGWLASQTPPEGQARNETGTELVKETATGGDHGELEPLGPGASLGEHIALMPPATGGALTLLELPTGTDAREGLREAVSAASGMPVTFGLGASVFAKIERPDSRPPDLWAMPRFIGDVLDEQLINADLLVFTEAAEPEAATELNRMVQDPLLRKGASSLWATSAFREDEGVEQGRPLSRNSFGFVEGQSNPPLDSASEVAIVSTDVRQAGFSADEFGWMAGSSYLALRILQLAVESWDEDSLERQRDIIGRKENGDWLGADDRFAPPSFDLDRGGSVTPLDAHVRLANPVDQPRLELLRRSWSYPTRGEAGSIESDSVDNAAGMLFMAFTRRLEDFETIQRRLEGEPLSHYSLAVGGGYFVVPKLDPSWVEDLLGGS